MLPVPPPFTPAGPQPHLGSLAPPPCVAPPPAEQLTGTHWHPGEKAELSSSGNHGDFRALQQQACDFLGAQRTHGLVAAHGEYSWKTQQALLASDGQLEAGP